MIEAASTRFAACSTGKCNRRCANFLNARAERKAAWKRQGLTGGLTPPHNPHRTIVIFACLVAVYRRRQTPGRRHSRSNAQNSCCCMPLSLVFVEANREAHEHSARPTFHTSPKLAMEAPPDPPMPCCLTPEPQPDALAVIDVKCKLQNYSQIVHTVTMPNKGDEFPPRFRLERLLVITIAADRTRLPRTPLSHHSRHAVVRDYIVDTKPDPTRRQSAVIQPEEIFKTGYSRPHTVHCGPEGIYVSTLGGGAERHRWTAQRLHHGVQDVRSAGRWELDAHARTLHYDFWWNLARTTW